MSGKYCLEELLYFMSENNEDEQEAIKGYSKLLEVVKNTVVIDSEQEKILKKLYKDIQEFIAEEMKHSEGLSKYYSELSGIVAETD